jgi:excisionase family DNA binding protein
VLSIGLSRGSVSWATLTRFSATTNGKPGKDREKSPKSARAGTSEPERIVKKRYQKSVKQLAKTDSEVAIMREESYSVSEAARVLGVSIPTLKRMAHDGGFESFRTPGGHLRITAESLTNTRAPRLAANSRPASSVLQNRRERVEELALEAQELRAQHEIERLRRDNDEEEKQRKAEIEADERVAARTAEAQRLRLERVRIQREHQEQERQETERLAAWRAHWLEKAMGKLPGWLSPSQRNEALLTLESEISKRRPECEGVMGRLTSDTIADLIAPWEAEREARELRERIVSAMLYNLPWGAKQDERIKAETLIRKALKTLPLTANEAECRDLARDSISDLRAAIDLRKATEERRLRQVQLTNYGVARVGWYLLTLHNRGELDDAEYLDWELRRNLETAVREELTEELQGNETEQDIEERAREIVDDELGFEIVEDDGKDEY